MFQNLENFEIFENFDFVEIFDIFDILKIFEILEILFFPNFILIIHIFFAIRDTDFPDMVEIQTVPGCCSLMVRPSGKVNASKYACKIPCLLIQVNARPVQSQFPDNPARLLGTPRWLCTCQSAVMFV